MPDVVDTAINAKVITPDVEADNGVIHIIDTVLIPEFMGKIEPVS